MGSQSRNSVLLLQLREVKWLLLGWLAEMWTRRWLRVSELEIPDLPCCDVEGGMQKLREVGMLEWTCHLRFTHT